MGIENRDLLLKLSFDNELNENFKDYLLNVFVDIFFSYGSSNNVFVLLDNFGLEIKFVLEKNFVFGVKFFILC